MTGRVLPAVNTARFTIELEQEQDERWIAEVLELPGVMTYGDSPEDAMIKVQALLALRVVDDQLERGESVSPTPARGPSGRPVSRPRCPA